MKRIKMISFVSVIVIITILTGCAANISDNTPNVIPPAPTIEKEEVVLGERISLNVYNNTLKCGEFFNLTATVFSDREMSVSYNSSDPSVATVSGGGRVVAVSEGNAIITVTGDGISASCTVAVVSDTVQTPVPTDKPTEIPTETPSDEVKPERIVIDYSSGTLYMNVGQVRTLKAKVYPEEASQEVYWILSNSRVATLDRYTGELKATYAPNNFGAGYATVTAMSADGSVVSAPLDITVIQRVQKITLNTEDSTLSVGDTLKLSYSYSPWNSYSPEFNFKSDNQEVASVSEWGTITANAPGVATITVEYDYNTEVYATVVITVSSDSTDPEVTPTPEEPTEPEVTPTPEEPTEPEVTPTPEEPTEPEVTPTPEEPTEPDQESNGGEKSQNT